jgi:hypothetical protein
MLEEHLGSYAGYKRGCREQCCKDAYAAYMKAYRHRKRGLAVAGSLSAPGGAEQQRAPATAPGAAELAVLRQVDGLSTAASNPAIVEAALAMARILDDPRQVTTQPSAAAKLESLIGVLMRGAERRQGRLALVQSMSQRGAGA